MYGFNLDWILIFAHYFQKYCGLSFLLWCNYDLSTFVEIPSFYKDMLKIWKKVQFYNNLDILWNNKLIKLKVLLYLINVLCIMAYGMQQTCLVMGIQFLSELG